LRTAPTQAELDSQAFAAFGTARVDDGTAATGFHANQKAVGTGAANFRGLVRAFHFEFLSIRCIDGCFSSDLSMPFRVNLPKKSWAAFHYRRLLALGQGLGEST
jgi:hypothetical protein